jgi:hypothetical protein
LFYLLSTQVIESVCNELHWCWSASLGGASLAQRRVCTLRVVRAPTTCAVWPEWPVISRVGFPLNSNGKKPKTLHCFSSTNPLLFSMEFVCVFNHSGDSHRRLIPTGSWRSCELDRPHHPLYLPLSRRPELLQFPPADHPLHDFSNIR